MKKDGISLKLSLSGRMIWDGKRNIYWIHLTQCYIQRFRILNKCAEECVSYLIIPNQNEANGNSKINLYILLYITCNIIYKIIIHVYDKNRKFFKIIFIQIKVTYVWPNSPPATISSMRADTVAYFYHCYIPNA